MPQTPTANTCQTPPWYSIRQRPPQASATGLQAQAAEIFIYGDIGENWFGDSITAAKFTKDIAALQASDITIRINSFGGSVTDGIAIHNAIKRHPATVTVCIDGIAASIASLIAMAGDTVEMSENAMLMIHAPWGGVTGNSAALRDFADMLDIWANAMATSYAAKSGQTTQDIQTLLQDGKDHWYTAAQALADGYVNTIIQASPESAAAKASFNLTRYRDLPATVQAHRTPEAAASNHPLAQANQNPEPLHMTHPANPQAAAPQAAPITQPAAAAPAAAATPDAPDAAAIRTQTLAQDQARRADIRANFQLMARHPGVTELMAACEANPDISVNAANQRLLNHLGATATPIAGGHIVTVEDASDKRRTAMVASMMVRAGVATETDRRDISANPYRGRTLLALAEASLQAIGRRTEGMDKRAIVAAAFTQSSSDFPVLFETAMHKTLLGAYATAALTWTRWCKRGSVSDFRAHTRYRTGSLGNLLAKNELGEYRNVAIPDGEKSSIAAVTKGYIINISREAVINDDLGALTDQSAAMGRAAARTIEADVYALLLSNSGAGPTMTDGQPLFHSSHNNIAGTAAAMSVDSFDAMRVLMAQQKDISGNDYLDMRPDLLLCPIGYGGTARVLNAAEYDISVTSKFQVPNRVRGLFRDVVDTPRLSGTAYYALASVNESAAIEVAFLDGNDQPYLEMETAFDTDGASYKVRLDYGVAGHDWRGAVKNAGA